MALDAKREFARSVLSAAGQPALLDNPWADKTPVFIGPQREGE
jgi:hypothetical protein